MNAAVSTADAFRASWRLALVVGAAASLTIPGVLPYALELLPADKRAMLPSLAIVVPLQMLQGFVLFSLLAWIGLSLGQRLGLDAPLLRGWMAHDAAPPNGAWWRAVLVGAVLAIVGVAIVVAALDPLLPAPRGGTPPSPTALQGFLASFYGGIAEEVQLRLFAMTLVAWLVAGFAGSRRVAIATGVLVAAVAFGALHLPAAAQVWPLDQVVVARTLFANALPGVVFGVLYARHGLEAAIAAHFLADIGLHVAAPLAAG
ncbi:MAG TPA: CPBP family intramembrane glutamic endopeptidase [Xanthomonadales bacterium]|nr:CPBP family intramembrane glutamic endopeptidase [Xanthomonadales bacterium]